MWNPRTLLPIWAGCVNTFSLLTVQYTWSFTVGMALGGGRSRRRLYGITLLSLFQPLRLLRGFWFMGYLWGGWIGAITAVLLVVIALTAETYGGILHGNELRTECLRQDR